MNTCVLLPEMSDADYRGALCHSLLFFGFDLRYD